MNPRPGDEAGIASSAAAAPVATDAVVIGAGPVGLFQVFELGLQDIRAHVIDALPHLGGQPAQLYPDKPIYDIPGLPVCTGQELADALAKQCAPFRPTFHLGQTVTDVAPCEDGRFLVQTSSGTRLLTRTLFIAAGVGAFEPKRLKVDGLDLYEGSQVFYHRSQAGSLDGKHVVVIGDDDQALEYVRDLCDRTEDHPSSITLLHRRDNFRAELHRVAEMRDRCQRGLMRFVVGQVTGLVATDGRLTETLVTHPDGSVLRMLSDVMLVLQGLSPRLGPITGWGLAMEHKLLAVDTEAFSTSVQGIFAVGDINTYPGKRKLLVCGFHECTLAAFAAAPIVYPERPVQLQYTTSSSELHRLLGVSKA